MFRKESSMVVKLAIDIASSFFGSVSPGLLPIEQLA